MPDNSSHEAQDAYIAQVEAKVKAYSEDHLVIDPEGPEYAVFYSSLFDLWEESNETQGSLASSVLGDSYDQQTLMPNAVATRVWGTVLRWIDPDTIDMLVRYVSTRKAGGVCSRSTYIAVLPFLNEIDTGDYSNYTINDDWPFLLDQFVDYARQELDLDSPRQWNVNPALLTGADFPGAPSMSFLDDVDENDDTSFAFASSAGLRRRGAGVSTTTAGGSRYTDGYSSLGVIGTGIGTGTGTSAGISGLGTRSRTSYTYTNEDNMVGLMNQGATCYLNSLIQSLYMTPEFREAIYRWEFSPDKDGDPTDCIPLQLQLLFYELQKKESRAVSTTGLTRSFGWTGAEAFTQHDVQELCRVLFDALDQCFKETPLEDIVNELYMGKMKDYVKCKSCGYESSRKDDFLDISLEVSGVSSIEEALYKWSLPELLAGDNQYSCSGCNQKVDALKGLSVLEFPYLLTLQLKRFTFDFQMMRRVKLNSFVSFPMQLDLSHFVGDADEAVDESRVRVFKDPPKVRTRRPATFRSIYASPESRLRSCLATIARYEASLRLDPEGVLSDYYQNLLKGQREKKAQLEKEIADKKAQEEEEEESDDSKADADAKADDPDQTGAFEHIVDEDGIYRGPEGQQGDLMYELFAILIHSGGSTGGHYYAYVKSLDTGKWYDFNDSSVSEVMEHEIVSSYGDKDDDSYWSSGTNAYMLLYRRIDAESNVCYPEIIPDHVVAILEMIKEKEKAELETRRYDNGSSIGHDNTWRATARPAGYTLCVHYFEGDTELEVKLEGQDDSLLGDMLKEALDKLREAAVAPSSTPDGTDAPDAPDGTDAPDTPDGTDAPDTPDGTDDTDTGPKDLWLLSPKIDPDKHLRFRTYSRFYDKVEAVHNTNPAMTLRMSTIPEGNTHLYLDIASPFNPPPDPTPAYGRSSIYDTLTYGVPSIPPPPAELDFDPFGDDDTFGGGDQDKEAHSVGDAHGTAEAEEAAEEEEEKEFRFRDRADVMVRLFLYNPDKDAFEKPHFVWLNENTATVADLQAMVESLYGVSPEYQFMVTNDDRMVELTGGDASRGLFSFTYDLLDTFGNNKVYIEANTPPSPPPTPVAESTPTDTLDAPDTATTHNDQGADDTETDNQDTQDDQKAQDDQETQDDQTTTDGENTQTGEDPYVPDETDVIIGDDPFSGDAFADPLDPSFDTSAFDPASILPVTIPSPQPIETVPLLDLEMGVPLLPTAYAASGTRKLLRDRTPMTRCLYRTSNTYTSSSTTYGASRTTSSSTRWTFSEQSLTINVKKKKNSAAAASSPAIPAVSAGPNPDVKEKNY